MNCIRLPWCASIVKVLRAGCLHHLDKTFLEDTATVHVELPLVPRLRHLPIDPPAINLAENLGCSPAESSFRCPGSEMEHQRDVVEL